MKYYDRPVLPPQVVKTVLEFAPGQEAENLADAKHLAPGQPMKKSIP